MLGYPIKSRDEDKRKLRCHVVRLEAANQKHKFARRNLEHKNRELEKQVKDLEKQVDNLEKEKDCLRQQRDRYRNMVFKPNKKTDKSEPPSTDNSPKEFSDPQKKKRGRKKGHKGTGRKKPERIDKIRSVYLTRCPICGDAIKRGNQINEHIVEDIPCLEKMKPEVIKYEIEEQWCCRCKKKVRAKPFGVIPNSRLGINLILFVMIQKYGAKSSWGSIIFMLSAFFNIKVSQGGLVKILHRARDWLGPYYDKILEEVRASAVKYADETSHRLDGITQWLWGFFTKECAYYVIEESRGKGVAEQNLGGSHEEDVLVRDDYGAYTKLPLKHQSCWAHLLRVSREAANDAKASKEVIDLHKQLKDMFKKLSRIIELPFNKKQRDKYHKLYKKEIENIIGQKYENRDTKTIQTRITNQYTNLITAVIHENVPLTNNLSERCIRPLVIIRKMSGGSRSRAGAKTLSVNMSIFQTIKMKNLPIIPTLKDYLLCGAKKS